MDSRLKPSEVSEMRDALTSSTVDELAKLAKHCVTDLGQLSRNAVDRNDINKAIVSLVSVESTIAKTDQVLKSMEAQIIQTNKELENGHLSATHLTVLRTQLRTTLDKLQTDATEGNANETKEEYKML